MKKTPHFESSEKAIQQINDLIRLRKERMLVADCLAISHILNERDELLRKVAILHQQILDAEMVIELVNSDIDYTEPAAKVAKWYSDKYEIAAQKAAEDEALEPHPKTL